MYLKISIPNLRWKSETSVPNREEKARTSTDHFPQGNIVLTGMFHSLVDVVHLELGIEVPKCSVSSVRNCMCEFSRASDCLRDVEAT